MSVEIGGQRNVGGLDGQILRFFVIGVVLWHLYCVQFGQPQVLIFRPLHVALYTAMAFLAFAISRKSVTDKIVWYDYVLALLALAPAAYMWCNFERISQRYAYVSPLAPWDWVFGIGAIVLAIEACRRSLGWTLPIMLAFFLLHAFLGPYFPGMLNQPAIGLQRLVDHTFMTTAGLYGSLTGLSATFIMMFVLFGAILDCAQGGKFFMSVSASFAGRLRGGSGKVAVLSSGLFGSISGSAVANVYATGSFTIPLMIRTGFRPKFAAAVEAIASSSGQLVPPIMGSAAFLIADFTDEPYTNVIKAAAVPAFFYLFAVYAMVHLEAVRNKIPAMSSEMILSARRDLPRYLHLGVPIVVIVVLLMNDRSPFNAAYWGIVTTFVVAQVFPSTRMNIRGILNALETGGRIIIPIATSLFVAGMIISTIELTGLGLRFTALLLSVTDGSLPTTLVLIMISCVILGMGLPTAAAYIIVAIFAAPALVKLGVEPLVAHLFVFYFAIISAITPPIAVAAYAAGSIARVENLQSVGFTALRLGIAVYLVPFVFILKPELLLIGEPLQILIAVPAGVVGIFALAAASQNFLLQDLKLWSRILVFTSAISMLAGDGLLLLTGLATFAAIGAYQFNAVSDERRKKLS